MILYAVAIFLSAFLLFQVQPMIAKAILPWYGGTTHVWTTCMLFFQVLLLAGYAYSHWLATRLQPYRQWMIHAALLAAALFFLPVLPQPYWKPRGDEEPTLAILIVLAVSIGLPYFLLSTTAPLIQSWQSRTHAGRSPYRLYALSNAGSLLALATYPFLVERFLPLQTQSIIWSIGFVTFALFCFWSGRQLVRVRLTPPEISWPTEPVDRAAASPAPAASIRGSIWLWIALPMAASIVLLATTNLMTTEVTAAPFMWVIPLGLYLLSFIICFDHPRWYVRLVFYPLFYVATLAGCVLIIAGPNATFPFQFVGYSAVCFFTSMVCHGELARIKPPPQRLTTFYLSIALGGALGGVSVAIVAPRIFNDFHEFPIGLFLAGTLSFVVFLREMLNRPRQTCRSMRGVFKGVFVQPLVYFTPVLLGSAVTLGGVLTVLLSLDWRTDGDGIRLLKYRDAYGLLTVHENREKRVLINGRITHGVQFRDPARSMDKTTYYGPGSGMGLALQHLIDDSEFWVDDKEQLHWRPLHIGVVGLGVGSISAWGRQGDRLRFYEINPAVKWVAEEFFTYLHQTPAQCEIILGDARIQLERELRDDQVQFFDMLVIDAFSSDSIPTHLLTREAFEIYEQHLAEDGVLAVHVSNLFLDLRPVVYHAAEAIGMGSMLFDHHSYDHYDASTWVILSRNRSLLDSPLMAVDAEAWPENMPRVLWTDDFASLLPIVQWNWGSEGWLLRKNWDR